MTLALYLTRLFALRFLAGLLALAALVQLVDLMDRSDEILDRGLGVAGLARYAVLRLPLTVAPVLPIAVLAGALFTFSALAWRNEVASMRAAGVPLGWLTLWLVPAGLLAGGLSFVVADRVAPVADASFARWWAATDPAPEAGGTLWFRAGRDVAGADRVAPDGGRLSGVELYLRDEDGLLDAVATAPTAEWRDGGWVLVDGTIRPAGGPAVPFESMVWPARVPPDNILELTRTQPLLSTAGLAAILAGDRAGGEPPQVYRIRLMRAFAQPLAPVVMILLATPLAGGMRRGGGIAAGMAVGLAAGLSYLVLDGILAALGEVGTLPPLLAVWVPHAVFASIGGALLINAEG